MQTSSPYGTMSQVRESIMEWLALNHLANDTHWYTNEEWAKRGEEHCNDADFVMVYDNALSNYLNSEFMPEFYDEIGDLASGFGYTFEQGTHYYAGFCRIDDFAPLPSQHFSYSAKLADQRWKDKAAQIVKRANNACESCGVTGTRLEVHHCYYRFGRQPWQYPSKSLLALCAICHETRAPLELEFRSFLSTLNNDELRVMLGALTRQGLQMKILVESLRAIGDQHKALRLYKRFLDSG